MNKRNFQKISLLHKPENAKSFGEGSYVFPTPAPLYEHGLQNEESRGVGYYMLNDEEVGRQSTNEYNDNYAYAGILDKFRTDGVSYQIDYDENVDEYTPGTAGGPGGRDRTLAIKTRKLFFFVKN